MNLIMLVFLAVVLIFGVIILVLILARGKTSSVLNVDKFRSSWLAIEQQVARSNPAGFQMAVFNADKLVDLALKQRGFKGATMGERMKSAQTSWSDANAVWSAHKVRNRIAHESDVNLSYDETRRALAGFKKGLKDLGAI